MKIPLQININNFGKNNDIFNFYDENNDYEKNDYFKELTLSSIKKEDDNCSLSYISIEKKEIISKLINYFKIVNKIKKKKLIFKKYFRFIYNNEGEKEKNNNIKENIYLIPIIKCNNYEMIFEYENKIIQKDIDEILNLTSEKQLFIDNDDNNKAILEQAYTCQIHNKKFIKNCSCGKSICEICLKKDHINHKEYLDTEISKNNYKKRLFILFYRKKKIINNIKIQ
jgi:hypothetical protein